MIIRGTCCSTECVHHEDNNQCIYAEHTLIYRGQCIKYADSTQEQNKHYCHQCENCACESLCEINRETNYATGISSWGDCKKYNKDGNCKDFKFNPYWDAPKVEPDF
jgi:hypothetical protein